MSGSNNLTQENTIKCARRKGMHIVNPGPRELQIDLDSVDALNHFGSVVTSANGRAAAEANAASTKAAADRAMFESMTKGK